MKIALFTHPPFLGSASMPRFAGFIEAGMRARGHKVSVWTPEARAWRLPAPASLKKWLGYVDQYLIFPVQIRRRLKACPPDTLFVFSDHALGPWVPPVANRPHVIHCHDFLAQRSAKGEIAGKRTGWTGRCYQAFIRRGYRRGRAFLSISEATQADLHRFLGGKPPLSKVVYNGFNGDFRRIEGGEAQKIIKALDPALAKRLEGGFVLHVGGNQWYKNRLGVVDAYRSWISSEASAGRSVGMPPLVLVGPQPSASLQRAIAGVPTPGRVEVLCDIPFEVLRALYNRATVFFFPSLAEGFGWPIAEAQACGAPVITTDAPPMTEVAGGAAEFLPLMPREPSGLERWRRAAADQLQSAFNWSEEERSMRIASGLANAARFEPEAVLDAYEQAYREVAFVSACNTGSAKGANPPR
jgi:glycosyltransferase involved in cell wall biosynthesis